MAGRKSKYTEFVEPRLSEITEMYKVMSESDIAEELGISVPTFEKYKKQYPELQEAIKKGRKIRANKLKSLLWKKAEGFHYKETKTTVRDVNGVVTTTTEVTEKYSPPDTGAIHLLLKNTDDEWRNDDKATLDLKREKLELEKEKTEKEYW